LIWLNQLDSFDYVLVPSVRKGLAETAGLYPAEDVVTATQCLNQRIRQRRSGHRAPFLTKPTTEIVGSKDGSRYRREPLQLETGSRMSSFTAQPAARSAALIQTIVDELLGRGKCSIIGVPAAPHQLGDEIVYGQRRRRLED